MSDCGDMLNIWKAECVRRMSNFLKNSVQDETCLALWICVQKFAYQEGLLDDIQIKKLEALPNWKWEMDIADWYALNTLMRSL